jgi:hypothetical protein
MFKKTKIFILPHNRHLIRDNLNYNHLIKLSSEFENGICHELDDGFYSSITDQGNDVFEVNHVSYINLRPESIEVLSPEATQMELDLVENNIKYEPAADTYLWAIRLVPADILHDFFACLEEQYEKRFLKPCNGDYRKADRLVKWQVLMFVTGYHVNTIKWFAMTIAGIFGITKFSSWLKSWFG